MTSSLQSMKHALKKFQQTRKIEDLLESAFTTGLAYLFRYIRGQLQQLHFEKVIFYAKRMKDMLGILLPSCVHFMETTPSGHSFSSATQVQKAEEDIVSQVLMKLDEGPKEGDLDQIDDPPLLWVCFIKPLGKHSLLTTQHLRRIIHCRSHPGTQSFS